MSINLNLKNKFLLVIKLINKEKLLWCLFIIDVKCSIMPIEWITTRTKEWDITAKKSATKTVAKKVVKAAKVVKATKKVATPKKVVKKVATPKKVVKKIVKKKK